MRAQRALTLPWVREINQRQPPRGGPQRGRRHLHVLMRLSLFRFLFSWSAFFFRYILTVPLHG